MPEKIRLRESSNWFAKECEKVLRDNDHKGGWDHLPTWNYLETKLIEEFLELIVALKKEESFNLRTDEQREAIVKECCDLRNICMMIATSNGDYEGKLR